MPMAVMASALRWPVSASSMLRAADLAALGQRTAALLLADPGEEEQDGRAERAGEAERPMREEDDEQIDRRPDGVEGGHGRGAGGEIAQRVEFAQRADREPAPPRLLRSEASKMRSPMRWSISMPMRVIRRERTSSSSADDGIERGGQGKQHEQGRDAAGGHDAVVDLQHEDRAGQHQHVDGAGEPADRLSARASRREAPPSARRGQRVCRSKVARSAWPGRAVVRVAPARLMMGRVQAHGPSRAHGDFFHAGAPRE